MGRRVYRGANDHASMLCCLQIYPQPGLEGNEIRDNVLSTIEIYTAFYHKIDPFSTIEPKLYPLCATLVNLLDF